MFYLKSLSNFIEIPFRINLLVSIICVLIFAFSSSASANEDIYQNGIDNDKKLLKQAEKLIRKDELKEAETVLRKILQINPKMADARLNLARIFLKQKKTNEAYNLAFDVALEDPNNAFAFAVLGNVLLADGNFRDAEISFKNALLIDKKEAFAWAGFGMLDFHENRLSESLKKLNTANFYKSNEPDFVFTFAKVAARSEKYKEAAVAYRKFLRISSPTDADRRDRIKGLIKFLEYLGNRQSLYDVRGEKQTSVPINLVGNRPVIQLKINNKDEILNFVLDTGSGMTVISERTAKRFKIKSVARGGKARAIGGNGKFEIVYGFLKSFELGDVQIKNVPVYIRKFHNPDGKVDGYLGISVLSKFLTTIDYGELTFSLVKKDNGPMENEGEVPVPLRLTTSGFLSGMVQLEGIEHTQNFIVDTGATISVISKNLANTSELKKYENEGKMRVIGAAGITDGVASFQLPRVTFGNFSHDDLTAIALDLDMINETTGFEQTGILGGNFLKNYRVTFDFISSKVLFVPIKK